MQKIAILHAMRTLSVRGFCLLFLLLFWSNKDSVFAQEMVFSGVGPINHSLAGAAVALPRDSAGAIYWNPATISFLDYSELQLGMGRHNAPWYGDEYVAGTVGIGLVAVLLVYAAVSDDDNDSYERERERQRLNDEGWIVINSGHLWIGIHDSSPDYSMPPPSQRPMHKPRPPQKPIIRVPTISYLYQPMGTRWSFGLGISEYGARKLGAIEVGDAVGISIYRFQGYEFMPTFAYRENRRFSMGISPIFSIDETPNASLPVIPLNRYSGISQDQRSRAGFGMQVGAYYAPKKRLRFGASVRTPQLIDRFTYRWRDPATGEVKTQQIYFSQDSAFRIAVGSSYTLRNDKTTFAVDLRYSDYSHASALYDIPASFDPEVKKQGNARGVYSLALGAEHQPVDILAFRMGYQWNHAVSPDKAVIYNTSLPIQSGHSIHYGLTAFFNEHLDLSLSISNAFGGGRETLQTESRMVHLRRNPNRSNFWIASRLRF